jgi:hypothetical protein
LAWARWINQTSGWTFEKSAPLGGIVKYTGVVVSDTFLEQAVAQAWIIERGLSEQAVQELTGGADD